MPTEAPARTHCPNCGAKLHRQDLSLCAYCAAPLTLGGAVDVGHDEIAKRLLRLREQPAFAGAMQWTPSDRDIEAPVGRSRQIAALLAVIGGTAVAYSLVRASTWPAPALLLAIGIGAIAAGAFVLVSALRMQQRARSVPILRRPALVVVRRSETGMTRGPGATTYYFMLHFDDGSEGEFRWPGQGTTVEPMPNGTTGVAYTRGARLIDFRKLT